MIKALFFDFYGTIGIYENIKETDKNTWDIIFNYINEKVHINYEEFIIKWTEIFSTTPSLDELERETIFMHKIYLIGKYYSLNLTNEEIQIIADQCLDLWHSYILLPINLHKTFLDLKSKFSLAIVSNFDHPKYLKSLLEENDMLKYFEYVLISGEIGINKPHKKIFNIALEKSKLSPNEVLFIGDNITEDMEGATNVGCHVVLMDRFDKHKSFKGDKISKLSDLSTFDYTRF